MSLKHSIAVSGVVALLATACGPMPGYHPPNTPEQERDQEAAASPRGAPAPAPDDNASSEDWSEDSESDDSAPVEDLNWETPPSERPPAPVYHPPVAAPPPAQPSPAVATPGATPQVRIIELDADSSYVIDDARGLCFFRFKGALSPIDCDKLKLAPTPSAPQPTPQPVAPQPVAPAPVPAAPAGSGAFSPVELRRFQDAFSAIYCDRQAGQKVTAEQRIAEAGLDNNRYNAIEVWMAEDEARWWSATDKARASCPR